MKELPPLDPSISVTTETIPQIVSQSNAEELLEPTGLTPVHIDPIEPVNAPTEPLEKIVTGDEAQLVQELNSLE